MVCEIVDALERGNATIDPGDSKESPLIERGTTPRAVMPAERTSRSAERRSQAQATTPEKINEGSGEKYCTLELGIVNQLFNQYDLLTVVTYPKSNSSQPTGLLQPLLRALVVHSRPPQIDSNW